MSCGRSLHLCISSRLAASDGTRRAAAEAPRAEGNKIGTPCVAKKTQKNNEIKEEVRGSCVFQTPGMLTEQERSNGAPLFGSRCPSAPQAHSRTPNLTVGSRHRRRLPAPHLSLSLPPCLFIHLIFLLS